jgi:hypothetical protein
VFGGTYVASVETVKTPEDDQTGVKHDMLLIHITVTSKAIGLYFQIYLFVD